MACVLGRRSAHWDLGSGLGGGALVGRREKGDFLICWPGRWRLREAGGDGERECGEGREGGRVVQVEPVGTDLAKLQNDVVAVP